MSFTKAHFVLPSYQTASVAHGSVLPEPTNIQTGVNSSVGHSVDLPSEDGVSNPNAGGVPTDHQATGKNTTTELAQGSPAGSVSNPPEGVGDPATVAGPCNQPEPLNDSVLIKRGHHAATA